MNSNKISNLELNDRSKIENFSDNVTFDKKTVLTIMFAIFHIIIFVFALFLSFRCNNGFNFWGFISAFFFPYIYIIYILAAKFQCIKSIF